MCPLLPLVWRARALERGSRRANISTPDQCHILRALSGGRPYAGAQLADIHGLARSSKQSCSPDRPWFFRKLDPAPLWSVVGNAHRRLRCVASLICPAHSVRPGRSRGKACLCLTFSSLSCVSRRQRAPSTAATVTRRLVRLVRLVCWDSRTPTLMLIQHQPQTGISPPQRHRSLILRLLCRYRLHPSLDMHRYLRRLPNMFSAPQARPLPLHNR
jgi:hypothetical protein